jgi:methionyl aminopeptidase
VDALPALAMNEPRAHDHAHRDPRRAGPLARAGHRAQDRGEFDAMRSAGALVARTLAAVSDGGRPGREHGELDALAEQIIRTAARCPSFLGYHGYPASICASVNEQIVHGIPSPRRVLADGDLLSVDCGAILDGWHGDAAVTLAVGTVSRRPGPVGGVRGRAAAPASRGRAGRAVVGHLARRADASATAAGATACRTGSSREYGGHGSAPSMHMDPFLPNLGAPGRARGCVPGWRWPSSPCSPRGRRHPRARRRLDGRDRRRQPGGALGAHGGDDRRRAADPHPAA